MRLLNLKVLYLCDHRTDLTYAGNTSGVGRRILVDFQSTPVVITYGSLNLLSVVNFRNNCESQNSITIASWTHSWRTMDGREWVREKERNAVECISNSYAAQLQTLAPRCERFVCRARDLCFVSSSHVKLLYYNGLTTKLFVVFNLSFLAFPSRDERGDR